MTIRVVQSPTPPSFLSCKNLQYKGGGDGKIEGVGCPFWLSPPPTPPFYLLKSNTPSLFSPRPPPEPKKRRSLSIAANLWRVRRGGFEKKRNRAGVRGPAAELAYLFSICKKESMDMHVLQTCATMPFVSLLWKKYLPKEKDIATKKVISNRSANS